MSADSRPPAAEPYSGADDPHPLRTAMEAHDFDAALSLFSPRLMLRSPVTERPFYGRDALDLLRLLMPRFESWECHAEFDIHDAHVMLITAQIGGRRVDLIDLLRHDEQGLISEFVVHARPMVGIAAFAATIGPPLAGRRGRARALAVGLLTRALPAVLGNGERAISRLGQFDSRAWR